MCAGVQQYPGGDSYDGEWKDDMKSGKGEPKRFSFFVVSFSEQNNPHALFNQSFLTRSGKYLWKDGKCYIGEYQNDFKTGKGGVHMCDVQLVKI
jgi:hypothetical protein